MTVIFYGAGVESVQGKWEEFFGEKEEIKEEKPKKPVKKRATKKKTIGEKKTMRKKTKCQEKG